MLNKLKKIKIISKYTFLEIIKSRVLLNTVFLGIALLILTFVAYNFTYGEPSRIALDFGMGMLSLSSVGVALFIGVGLLSKELDSRTVYMIISRPVSRGSFICGKLFGLSLILLVNVIILAILTLTVFFVTGGEFQNLILWSTVFIYLEALLILFLVSLLSLITTPTLSVILTILLYIAGHAIESTKMLTFVNSRESLQKVIELYHFVLPGFYKLNLKDYLLYEQDVSFNYLVSNLSYGICYLIFLLFISIFVFEKRNLN